MSEIINESTENITFTKVDELPQEIREQIIEWYTTKAATFREISRLLAANGYNVGCVGIYRWLQKNCDKTETAPA